MLTILLLLVTSATAAVVQMPAPRAAEASPSLPGYLQGAKNRDGITLSAIAYITSSSTKSNKSTPKPTSTHKARPKTSTKAKAKASQKDSTTTTGSLRITASASLPILVAIPNCTPVSICVDAMTCSQRYGGCYDQNYCDGNTSPYPIPTCIADPGADLTSNHVVAERNDTDGAGKDAVVEAVS